MFERITIDLDQMGGEPCIRGLRIPVATVVTLVAQGLSVDQILSYYPDLEKDDIKSGVKYIPIYVFGSVVLYFIFVKGLAKLRHR